MKQCGQNFMHWQWVLCTQRERTEKYAKILIISGSEITGGLLDLYWSEIYFLTVNSIILLSEQ